MNSLSEYNTTECDKVRVERENPTVAENIERKIQYHQREIARLEEAKLQMAPLLHMKIGDMREVMSY